MSNIKISQLPAASTIDANNDVLPVVNSNITKKVTPNLLVKSVLASPGPIGSTSASTATFTGLAVSGNVDLNGYITSNDTAAWLYNPRFWDTTKTHSYRLNPSEISADRYINLPALTANDTFVFEAHPQVITNKVISGSNNTLSNIANSSLTNSAITINGTSVSLGGSITLSGSTQWTTSGSNIYYNTGNVGFNNVSPTQRVDVVGTVKATGSFTPVSSSWTSAAFRAQGSFGGGLSLIDGAAGWGVWTESSGDNINFGQGTTSGGLTKRWTINSSGALALGGNYGTTGQVLTSGGGGAMTWATPTSASTGWTLSGSNTYTNELILQGITSPVTSGVFTYCSAQFAGNTGNVGGNIGILQYSDDASCAFIAFGKSRSATKGAYYAQTLDGDDLGETRYDGTTGSAFSSGGFTTAIVENRDTSSKICMTYNIWTTSRSYGGAQINSANATDGHFVVNPSDFAPQRNVPLTGPNVVTAFVNPNSGRFMLGTKALPTYTMGAAVHPGYFVRGTPCHVATTANITLSGLQVIDGITVKVNDIVLVKNQTTSSQNGIYRAQSSSWTRYNESNGTGNFTVWTGFYSSGKYTRFHVYYGSTNGQLDFVFNGATSGVVGSTAITFAQADRWDYGPDTNHDFLVSYWSGSAFTGVKVVKTSADSGWVAYSDERLKTITGNIDNALHKACSLRTVIGYMNRNQYKQSVPMLIAQDVQAVLPEAVIEDNDDNKTLLLSYQGVIPLLVAAIKELSAKVEALEQANG